MVDEFWGEEEWYNFYTEIRRVSRFSRQSCLSWWFRSRTVYDAQR